MIKEGTGLWLHYSSINHLHMRSDIPPPEAIQQWTLHGCSALCVVQENCTLKIQQDFYQFYGFITAFLNFGANCCVLTEFSIISILMLM